MTSHGNAAAAAGELLKISQDPAATPTAFRDATRRLGASVDSLKLIRDSMGRSLLHNAAQSGSSALVEHLIDKLGFDVNVQDERGETPLALAAATGRADITQLLLRSSADVNRRREPDGTAPVHRAAAVDNGSTEVLQLLLEAGAKADVSSETGTPLCWAAGAGLERAVRLLLAYGADPNVSSGSDVTVLCMAAASGSVGTVKALLEAGAAHSTLSKGGATPLHVAAAVGGDDAKTAAVIAALVEAGAETLARDSDGHTAIEVAAIQGRRAVVEALLPHTSTSARPGVDPWTADALMEATKAERAAAEAARKEAEANSSSSSGRGVVIIPGAEDPNPELAAARKREGDEAFVSGRYEDAVTSYTASLRHDTRNAVVWANRAAANLRLDRSTDALSDARCSRVLDPKYAKAWYREGAALGQLKEWEEAANCYYEAMGLLPGNKEMEDAFQHAIQEARKQYQAAQKQ